MEPLAGLTGKVIAFQPHRVFYLTRALGTRNHRVIERLTEEIRGFMAVHGEAHVIARSASRIATHITHGEVVLIHTEEARLRRLIGVCLCLASTHRRPVLELAYTAVDRQFRGRRLAQLAASAALISHLINHDEISGIVMACRPDNWLCQRAATELGVDFWPAAELMDQLPPLRSLILRHRVDYIKRDWCADPLIGLVRKDAVRTAARLVRDAARLRGLAWSQNSRVYLDGEWNLSGPNNDGTRQLLDQMTEGRLPWSDWWQSPPPSPQMGRCA
jgi:hypothetical protein